MRFRTISIGAAVAAAVVCSAAPSFAEAEPPPGTAVISNLSDNIQARVVNVRGHDVRAALVTFDYTCAGTGTEKPHLFVAVKQGPDVVVGSSSSDAVTFYSTNWHSDKNFNRIVCDGEQRHARVLMGPDPFFRFTGGEHPALEDGPAFLQICVFDKDGGLTMDYSMQNVSTGAV
jgi:hypothetical protein